jgi:hypothetical protein
MLDQHPLNLLVPELKILLDAELAAGNEVKETNIDFPRAGAVFVGLRRQFRAIPTELPPGVVFRAINDVHWWQAEYEHLPTGHYLVCGFDE